MFYGWFVTWNTTVTVILPFDRKVRLQNVKEGQILKYKILDKKHMFLIQFCSRIPMVYLVLVYDIYKNPNNI